MTPAEAAEMAVRYHQLKNPVRVVLDDGEAMTVADHERETAVLNKRLREHIEETGEPISVEGLPDLFMQPSSAYWYRLDAMIRENPELVDELVRLQAIDIKRSLTGPLQKAGLLAGLSKYEVAGHGTGRLTFDKRGR